MARRIVIDEQSVDAVVQTIQKRFAQYLDEANAELKPREHLAMFHDVFDDYVEPSEMRKLPAASVFVSESEDYAKDRAMDQNVAEVRILIGWIGPSKIGYRYTAALTSMVLREKTLMNMIGRARVKARKFYTPISVGNQEIRGAEVFLEIEQEVMRR